jgi:uncharacterized membrane protein YoaK (UPF0700 family)
MNRYEREIRTLAYAYAALAGFVDAIGFLASGGLFVSFMSGNSTRLALGIEQGSRDGLAAAALIMSFVVGVVLSSLALGYAKQDRRAFWAAASVAGLLVVAASLQSLGLRNAFIGTLCLAMGASNTVFQRDGDVGIGVSYMTGTLVKLGHRLADALRGGDRTAWLPYLFLWLSLVIGGIAGAALFAWSLTASLWSAAAFAIVLAGSIAALAHRRN